MEIANERAKSVGKTVMGAVALLDGFIADDNDYVRPLFEAEMSEPREGLLGS